MFTTAIIALTINAAAQAPTSIRKYEITADSKSTAVQVNIGSNRITSIRFNRTFEAKTLFCGDSNRFIVQALDESQINIKAVSEDLGASTNCTMLTKAGLPVVLNLLITEGKRADAFVDVIFKMSDLPTTEAELARRLEGVETQIKAAADTARKECNDRYANSLVQDATSAIVFRRVDARTISSNVLLTVKEFLKIGSRGFIRFFIDHQSRDPFATGAVKVTISEPGKEGFSPDDLTFYFAQPVLERNEQTFGAVSFSLHEVSDSARISIKVFERNGVRHPEISDLRL